LRELWRATTIPQRRKERADLVRMNAQGGYVSPHATDFNWHVETVENTLKRMTRIQQMEQSWLTWIGKRVHMSR
jgi:hypothetical protein